MLKNEFLEKITKYLEYAKSVDVHQKPEKGLNSGAWGRAYEQIAKEYFHVYDSLVSSAGKFDIETERFKIEIKTGCGELGVVDEHGNMTSIIKECDYVFYSPFYAPGDTFEESTYVLTSKAFFDALETAGMIRPKASSLMTRRKQMGEPWYYDRKSIQSYMNSKKKLNCWLDALEEFGMTVEEWERMMEL